MISAFLILALLGGAGYFSVRKILATVKAHEATGASLIQVLRDELADLHSAVIRGHAEALSVSETAEQKVRKDFSAAVESFVSKVDGAQAAAIASTISTIHAITTHISTEASSLRAGLTELKSGVEEQATAVTKRVGEAISHFEAQASDFKTHAGELKAHSRELQDANAANTTKIRQVPTR